MRLRVARGSRNGTTRRHNHCTHQRASQRRYPVAHQATLLDTAEHAEPQWTPQQRMPSAPANSLRRSFPCVHCTATTASWHGNSRLCTARRSLGCGLRWGLCHGRRVGSNTHGAPDAPDARSRRRLLRDGGGFAGVSRPGHSNVASGGGKGGSAGFLPLTAHTDAAAPPAGNEFACVGHLDFVRRGRESTLKAT